VEPRRRASRMVHDEVHLALGWARPLGGEAGSGSRPLPNRQISRSAEGRRA
jgi:hypothetical protein